VQKLKLIYDILYRISVKYFEFNLNKKKLNFSSSTYYNCYGSLLGLLFLNMILENFVKLNL